MEIHEYTMLFGNGPYSVINRLDRIERLLLAVAKELKLDIQIGLADLNLEAKMSAAIDRITASVNDIKSKDDSLIALVGTIAQELRDANTANDPAINALADSLDAESAKIVDAVNNNTPPPPTP